MGIAAPRDLCTLMIWGQTWAGDVVFQFYGDMLLDLESSRKKHVSGCSENRSIFELVMCPEGCPGSHVEVGRSPPTNRVAVTAVRARNAQAKNPCGPHSRRIHQRSFYSSF